MAPAAVDAIRQLQDRSSAKRRSAAKRLRKLGDPYAGPALLEALKNEVRDSRTWETQCLPTPVGGPAPQVRGSMHSRPVGRGRLCACWTRRRR
ncbi:hypothetical protein [Streptomyces niveus]|uniref:hypothetical protein n=1 Tax=Streptomyces niveus TaxID=193462 RepID=UPI0036637A39